MSDAIIVEITQAVATFTLNRPDRINAVDMELAVALRDAALRAESDPDVRAVVIRGAGRGFMAGGDIRVFHENLDGDIARVITDLTHELHDGLMALRRMPKPVIASVHGPCAGAGFSTAMACDLVIAAESSFYTLAYSMLGTSPDGSSTYSLPRLVGFHKAAELIYLSDRFDAAKAQDLGLVNFVVPDDDLEGETKKLADRLAAGPTIAFGHAKALLNRSLTSSIESQLAAETQGIAACSRTADFAEGVRAFVAKRKPDFTGK